MKKRGWRLMTLGLALLAAGTVAPSGSPQKGLTFSISFEKAVSSTPLDGRILLLISTDDKTEPRSQVSGQVRSAQVFGVDVEGLKPGEPAAIDSRAFGYPERDWKKLGPKLTGKIRIYCGDMDNYYLNNAVYLTEDFLKKTTDPPYGGEVDYGDRAEHCWNGDHANPNHISRLRYNTFYLPKILKRIQESAPPGADLASWKY